MTAIDSGRALKALRELLDRRAGIYRELADAKDAGAYLIVGPERDDEEILTEPLLAEILERVLGFPPDAYFPQLSKSGLKPDFTPMDLIAHPFVLDAKSSRQHLEDHEAQIRGYIIQRQLDFGVLFNLHGFAVYRRGSSGPDPTVSFSVEALWRLSRDEAQPGPDFDAFERFLSLFSFRAVGQEEKINAVREAPSWEERSKGDELKVDVDLLVEQLRRLSRLLADDADSQPESLATHVRLNPDFEARLLAELAAIAQDIRPRIKEDALPTSFKAYRSGNDLERRVWRQYTLRVSQLTLARTLLYRAWEDAGFVREQLYDGGFRDAYAAHGEKVRDVLRSAFAAGAQRYHWLFEQQTTYDWYTPRDAALVEVLYSLTQFPLDRLDADVLGGLYESYVDEIDRDRLGQFYTPRAVVRFMLDRVAFSGPEGVMRIEGDAREPFKTLDFASGSGGFDVEIARRVIDESGALKGGTDHQLDALSAIAKGLHAIEISPFPYYLTEINLLLQVSRLLGALTHADHDVGSFVLSVVHEDALKAKPSSSSSFEGLGPEFRADHALLVEDERFGLEARLDPEKQAAFTRIREGNFDLVIGNPPYVAEANNKPLFERLRRINAWDGIYRGKSDYYYYFLYMAAELLAPGGKLCVVVPASWMNAGNADWLRSELSNSLRLDELFLFGSYRLFAPEDEARSRVHRAPTPTIESAILIATKAKTPLSHKLRVVALEDEGVAGQALDRSGASVPRREDLLKEMARRAEGREGRKGGIHVHDVPQSELKAERPWPVKHEVSSLPMQVVGHLDVLINTPDSGVEELSKRWLVFMGIETGADTFTPKMRSRLAQAFPDVLKSLEGDGYAIGDPILELPAGVEQGPPWVENPELLAKGIEPGGILYGAVDDSDYRNLVWLARSDDPPKTVLSSLAPWRQLLEARAEFVRNDRRQWWECAWPRDKSRLRSRKLIGVHRTDRARFAVDTSGEWQTGKGGVVVAARDPEQGLSIELLGGYLNSELLDLWYGVRGRTARDIWRDYEPKPMSKIPYRYLNIGKKKATPRLKGLKASLKDGDVESTTKLTAAVIEDLRVTGGNGLLANSSTAFETASALEMVVERLAENRRALLSYRESFPELARVVKDPWSTETVDPDAKAFVDALPKKVRASIRVDPDIVTEIGTDGPVGRAALKDGALVFSFGRQQVARLEGPIDKVMLLSEVLSGLGRLTSPDLLKVELPRDIDGFRERVESASADVVALLAEGRILVEAAERLVCAIYGVPPDLTDEVVAHAVARTRAFTPSA